MNGPSHCYYIPQRQIITCFTRLKTTFMNEETPNVFYLWKSFERLLTLSSPNAVIAFHMGEVLLKFLILFYFFPKLHSNCAPTYFSNSRCRGRTSFGEKLAKEREVQRVQLQPEMDRAIRLPILPILPILPKLPNIAKSCQHPLNPAKICQILPTFS